ncbi:HAD-IA family hydrolase [bacterium]|nr:HAD-IA family hydrolase [bacterium]
MIKVIAFDLNGVLFPTPRKINSTVLEFVKECKSLGFMTVAASNASKGSFEWRSRKFGLMNVFDGRVISSDIGIRKPSKEFFEYMIEILGFFPEEILLVDDSDRNIQNASELGIVCVKYEGEESLDVVRKMLE